MIPRTGVTGKPSDVVTAGKLRLTATSAYWHISDLTDRTDEVRSQG
jgi:hypothetical protein